MERRGRPRRGISLKFSGKHCPIALSCYLSRGSNLLCRWWFMLRDVHHNVIYDPWKVETILKVSRRRTTKQSAVCLCHTRSCAAPKIMVFRSFCSRKNTCALRTASSHPCKQQQFSCPALIRWNSNSCFFSPLVVFLPIFPPSRFLLLSVSEIWAASRGSPKSATFRNLALIIRKQ